MNRIEGLREVALKKKHDNTKFYYLFHKRYSESNAETKYGRYSDAYEYAFENLTPTITDGELIVGELCTSLDGEQLGEWRDKYEAIAREQCSVASGGQDSHMAIDYELLLSLGINGIIERIDGYLEGASPDTSEFYRSVKECLGAITMHSEKYSRLASEMAEKESDDERRRELINIARITKKVPAMPAETLWEAIQSVHFVSYALTLNPLRMCHQQFQLGRPDRYLYPYYKKDIEEGRITKEKALLLLDCLGIQINMRVPNGLSCGYMVGGRDKYGKTVSNELTEMLIRVIGDIRLVYPSVGLCYTDDTPDEILNLACTLLSEGRSHPAIFGDDTISKGLESYGVPKEEAHDYIHSTCVEITPVASSNVWVASPYTNLAEILLLSMDREYGSFDEHLSRVLGILDERIKLNFNEQNGIRERRRKNSINPPLSAFVNDCLGRGLDIEAGGAKYNWIMPSFVGMSNLVDSLYALKKTVYEKREYTVLSLKEILEGDFEGHEELRRRLLFSIPKYGNDNDEVDAYFNTIVSHITSECRKYTPILPEGKLIPSVFCWIKHEIFGRQTGATPDGRHAGFPLGDGSGPCQGREFCGPTASILSSTKWDHSKLIGGVAVNMKFSKSSLGKKSIETMAALVKSYIKRGGFEMQINVTDREILEKAIECPEDYADLVVRIGGYSDYFTRLSRNMQRELIERTEHVI